MVCAGCSLAEAREAQARKRNLYQLVHRQGQVVMKVNWVSSSWWWNELIVPRIRVRGEDSLFEKLTAEENLFKEVEITGIPSSSPTTRTLDIGRVMILG